MTVTAVLQTALYTYLLSQVDINVLLAHMCILCCKPIFMRWSYALKMELVDCSMAPP